MTQITPGQVTLKPKTQIDTGSAPAITRTEAETKVLEVFSSIMNFEAAQRMAMMLAKSSLIPKEYQDNVPNIVVALEMSHRIGASPLMVMQNLNVIQGKPSWSSTFIIAAINSCGRFSPLRFEIKKLGEKIVNSTLTWYDQQTRQKQKKEIQTKIQDMSCRAFAIDLKSGQELDSPPVSVEMAVKEGWYSKDGSKWQTMPELMLRYRAASFFGRLYAPDILYGMQTQEEVEDAKFTEVEEERPRVKLQSQPEVAHLNNAEESAEAAIEIETDPTPGEAEISPATAPEQENHAEEQPQPEPAKRTRKPKPDPEPEQEEAALFPIPEQLVSSDDLEIMDPPPADFVDADEIIFFMQDSEDLADFERKRQLVKTSYNRLPQAQKTKVIDAMERFKQILKQKETPHETEIR